MHDLDAVRQRGFFDGYNPVVWVVVMLQASSFIHQLIFKIDETFLNRLSVVW